MQTPFVCGSKETVEYLSYDTGKQSLRIRFTRSGGRDTVIHVPVNEICEEHRSAWQHLKILGDADPEKKLGAWLGTVYNSHARDGSLNRELQFGRAFKDDFKRYNKSREPLKDPAVPTWYKPESIATVLSSSDGLDTDRRSRSSSALSSLTGGSGATSRSQSPADRSHRDWKRRDLEYLRNKTWYIGGYDHARRVLRLTQNALDDTTIKSIAQQPSGLDNVRKEDRLNHVHEITFEEIFKPGKQQNLISELLNFFIEGQAHNVWMPLSLLNVKPTLLDNGTFRVTGTDLINARTFHHKKIKKRNGGGEN